MAVWQQVWYGDTGNGAIKYKFTSADEPGVLKFELSAYAVGRGDDRTWHEAEDDPDRKHYGSIAAARNRYNELQRLKDADYRKYLAKKAGA